MVHLKERSPSGFSRRWLWVLFPVIWIGVVTLAILLAVRFHAWIPVLVGAVLVGAVVTWVLGCTLSPAVPNRVCPRCKADDGLVRLRSGQVLGVRCRRCGFVDENLYRAYLDEV